MDMINHSPFENVSVVRNQDSLEIRSTRSIDIEQIHFSYHWETSRFWICEYGFWIDGNEFDDLDLTREVEMGLGDVRTWLEEEGYWGYDRLSV
jgi:hypothetical protein